MISRRVKERSKQNDTHNNLRQSFVAHLVQRCFIHFYNTLDYVSKCIISKNTTYCIATTIILFKIRYMELLILFYVYFRICYFIHAILLELIKCVWNNCSKKLRAVDYTSFRLSNEMQNKNLPNILYPFYIHWWQKLNQRENCLCRFCVFEYKNVRG